MITDLLTQTATILTRSESEGADLDPVFTTSSATSPCYLAPAATDEQYAAADTIRYDAVCYLPATAVVDHADAITVDGVTYEVVGEPERWMNARLGELHHLQVKVRRTG